MEVRHSPYNVPEFAGSACADRLPVIEVRHFCYSCDGEFSYLFRDGRCYRCTRCVPEEKSACYLCGDDSATLHADGLCYDCYIALAEDRP